MRIESSFSFSFIDHRLEMRSAGENGTGLFASGDIQQDELLVLLGGAIMPATAETGDHGVQISAQHVLATPPGYSLSPADYINHSCDPNAGFNGQIAIVAIRPIKPNEEVVIDYAMCLYPVAGAARYRLKCLCGKPNCRGFVTEDDWSIPALQTRYNGYFQWFLQKMISESAHKPSTL